MNERRPLGELREWVACLRDLGVREMVAPSEPLLRVGTPAPPDPLAAAPLERAPLGPGSSVPASPSTPARGTPAAPRRTAPLAAAAGPDPQAPPDARSQEGFDEPAPADPAAALATLRETIGDCTRCKLHAGRNKLVFGVGSPRAQMMFVGEGPGRDEDLRGEPFVGRAGQKLDEMIDAIGLSREEVYIANVVKCRPPNNRDPESDEVATCSPFLFAQIAAIRPRVIVTLGGPATKLLLDTKIGITRLRGTFQSHRGIPVMPTFHPAYLLRNYTRETRTRVWEDLKAARALLGDGH